MASRSVKETFWPLLRNDLLNDPSGMERLSLPCVACSRVMSITDDDRSSDYTAHAACILPCGHMIGYSCQDKRNEMCLHHCPSCRGDLKHPRCGHPFRGIHMPTNIELFSLVPPTVAERGGVGLAPNCRECGAMHLLKGLDHLFFALDPTDKWPRLNQFFGFAIVNGSEVMTAATNPEAISHIEREEIPDYMAVFAAEAAARYQAEGKKVWRTWKAGDGELWFGLLVKDRQRKAKQTTMIDRIFGRK
ncbi:hypothetical protein ACJ41O_012573 [Fusarium nematophilum]